MRPLEVKDEVRRILVAHFFFILERSSTLGSHFPELNTKTVKYTQVDVEIDSGDVSVISSLQ